MVCQEWEIIKMASLVELKGELERSASYVVRHYGSKKDSVKAPDDVKGMLSLGVRLGPALIREHASVIPYPGSEMSYAADHANLIVSQGLIESARTKALMGNYSEAAAVLMMTASSCEAFIRGLEVNWYGVELPDAGIIDYYKGMAKSYRNFAASLPRRRKQRERPSDSVHTHPNGWAGK